MLPLRFVVCGCIERPRVCRHFNGTSRNTQAVHPQASLGLSSSSQHTETVSNCSSSFTLSAKDPKTTVTNVPNLRLSFATRCLLQSLCRNESKHPAPLLASTTIYSSQPRCPSQQHSFHEAINTAPDIVSLAVFFHPPLVPSSSSGTILDHPSGCKGHPTGQRRAHSPQTRVVHHRQLSAASADFGRRVS